MLRQRPIAHCLHDCDPAALNGHYLRQLILVATHGDDTSRRRFVTANAVTLGGYTGYLLHLSEDHLREVFADALRAQRGDWPETLMGFRLAIPAHPPSRRGDMWAGWRTHAAFHPASIALDPICGMFVDPGATPYRLLDGDRVISFCCKRCLDSYSAPDEDSHGTPTLAPLDESGFPLGA